VALAYLPAAVQVCDATMSNSIPKVGKQIIKNSFIKLGLRQLVIIGRRPIEKNRIDC
jgi:hypothetical protein